MKLILVVMFVECWEYEITTWEGGVSIEEARVERGRLYEDWEEQKRNWEIGVNDDCCYSSYTEIIRLRETELYPQLLELVKGYVNLFLLFGLVSDWALSLSLSYIVLGAWYSMMNAFSEGLVLADSRSGLSQQTLLDVLVMYLVEEILFQVVIEQLLIALGFLHLLGLGWYC